MMGRSDTRLGQSGRKGAIRIVRIALAWVLPFLLALGIVWTGHAAPLTQTAARPTQARVLRNSNLRAGPGTNFDIVGYALPGQLFPVIGCNADCTWYQLAPDCWIAAFLVTPVQTVDARASLTQPVGTALSVTGTVTGGLTATGTISDANVIYNPTKCPQTARPSVTYAGPGASYGIVDSRPQGLCVAVVGRDEGAAWFQLSHGMWILAADVRYAEPVRTIPVTSLTPTPTATPLPSPTPDATPTPSSVGTSHRGRRVIRIMRERAFLPIRRM